VIAEADVIAVISNRAELSSDAIRQIKTGSSKIFISIVYLWTGRGPEINNEIGAAAAAALFRDRARSRDNS